MAIPKKIFELSDNFSSLPGIGPKLSNRIALYLAVTNKKLAVSLSRSLEDVVNSIRQCGKCFNVTDIEECEICSDAERNSNTILIVENALDLYSIEDTGVYSGLYHVLNGVISPVNGVGPTDLTINELLSRCKELEVTEVISGLNPNLEGDSTAMFIKEELEKVSSDIVFSRLAKGIPTGGSIEFMSTRTIAESIQSRDNL